MPLDFKVTRLEYKDLCNEAQRLRALGNISSRRRYFDIVDLLHNVVVPALTRVGKNFSVEIDDAMENPAEVDLKDQVLYVEKWVLKAAREGDLRARLIVAHEIAHMILHKDQVMAFSDEKAVQLNHLQDEESAEWQAQNFALILLLSDEVIIETRNFDLQAASIVTSVEESQIEQRRLQFELQNRVYLDCFVDTKCECGDSAIIRLGASALCKSCGKLT